MILRHMFNPLSPNIIILILHTDLHTFLKIQLREFDKRSKRFLIGDHSRDFRIVLGSTRKQYRIGLLFTLKNSDFGAVSVRLTANSEVKRHIPDRFCATLWCCVTGFRTLGEVNMKIQINCYELHRPIWSPG